MKKSKKWSLIILALFIIGSLVWWWLAKRNQAPIYSTVTVVSGPLVQTVSETGTLKPVKEVALNFLSSGRIKSVAVKVGDKVSAGTVLAALDDSSLQTKKLEAEAGLQIAQASLSKILAGASTQTVAISRSTVNQAQAEVDSAKVNLEKTRQSVAENIRQAEKTLSDLELNSSSTLTPSEQAVATAQTALDNAEKTGKKNVDNARNSALLFMSDKILSSQIALDNINTILEDNDAKPVLSVKNSSLLAKTRDARLEALALISPANQAVNLAKSLMSEAAVSSAGASVLSLLLQTDQALDYAYSMLEATITSVDFSQTKLDSYKSLISGQSSQINTAISGIENSIQAFHNALLSQDTSIAVAQDNLNQAQSALSNAILAAKNNLNSLRLSGDQQIASAQARLDSANQNLALAQAQLNNTVAPARSQDVALAQAQVSQAQASLAGIEQQISDTVLTAPLDGVVTAVNYEIGEQFSAGGKAMIIILVNNSFNVEVDIAESNISKVELGDDVDITFDAFPDDFILKGKVSFIEPAQTLIQDVVYYKVKIDFSDLGDTLNKVESRNLSLKAGMTANIIITTDKRDEVVQVPARAIIEQDGQKIVRLLVNGVVQEQVVETGMRGDEGMIEVVSGLRPGDIAITFVKNSASN
ncbi:MAG TPA: efflux RND transporter periplasmic adaptor subunit [bacterium]|jgi:HlyD family secretion protein|nr:MAG: Macrolide export protein MacA [Parcubacteria group bacterium ADurb.Bin115]HNU81552.1 efflux RND transporter periplasmic adaptor subunit [bacterium]HPW05840.1 efflux RND transporter periplasmic adaptor subunit [bacterium]HPY99328.1 efflux RND transporter periplasmic adaptor subunit [bacterium]HQB76305.1 efflux RND transporter periplasmic adaptor subunit [bacterium]